ncbi:hypothetical protein [Chryseobacterium wangxinyae]|uniref:hypothetical protein n=1 Tax=Chryseobacterium sp. CY353 TaxID=2997334 RepID=UPI00226FDA36|nr:hypothetical protein [Chryseobacterium sp. CY353]MCY0969297.1 hypothetical protein [Chryseobacterium sp. CY353]
MKDISLRIKSSFQNFENNSLNNDLFYLLKDTLPFTEQETISELDKLDDNSSIDASEYYSKLYTILNTLLESITENENEVKSLKNLLNKYSATDSHQFASEGNALVSIIFKDLKSTGTLKEFTKSLNKWNRALLLYYTLLKSDSPEEIDLIEIQNGSIDVVCNIDFDVSLDLTKVVMKGLAVYGAYLLYKSKMAKEIIASYMGNRKLISTEKEREKLMLLNIYETLRDTISEQHKENVKNDKGISKEGVDKKIDEVSKVIAEHIIKGNEIKLLTYGTQDDKDLDGNNSEENTKELADKLRENTSIVRERFNLLEAKDKQLLLETYTIKDDDEIKG